MTSSLRTLLQLSPLEGSPAPGGADVTGPPGRPSQELRKVRHETV